MGSPGVAAYLSTIIAPPPTELVWTSGCSISQRLMWPLTVVEGKVFRQPIHQFTHGGIAIEVHVFMLYAAPQAFEKDVVNRADPPIHADGVGLALDNAREDLAGKLRALVAVEHFGIAMLAHGILQAIHAKHRLHGVADPPAQDPSGGLKEQAWALADATRNIWDFYNALHLEQPKSLALGIFGRR
jgi:hypothetical protein